MRRIHSLPLAILAALHLATSRASAQDLVPVQLTVEMRDLARVPSAVLRETQTEVERTFLASGVRIAWRHPAASPPDPSALKVYVVAGAPAGASGEDGRSATVVGVAPQAGSWVQVFYGRVAAAVAERPIALSLVLAHVISHELGHLLLPPGYHAPFGIMRRAVDLEHPALRRFTDGQSRLIRAAVVSGQRYASRCDH
jgi:hypothetical protein